MENIAGLAIIISIAVAGLFWTHKHNTEKWSDYIADKINNLEEKIDKLAEEIEKLKRK